MDFILFLDLLLIPERFRKDSATLDLARICVGFIIILFITSGFFSFIYFICDHRYGGYILLSGPVYCFLCTLLMRYSSLYFIANLLCFGMYSVFLSVCIISGGVVSSTTMWFSAIPVLVLVINGPANSIIWGIISTATISIFFFGELSGFKFLMLSESTAQQLEYIQKISNTGLILFFLAFCILFEIKRKKILTDSTKHRFQSEQSVNNLRKTSEQLTQLNFENKNIIKEATSAIATITTGISAQSVAAQSLSKGAAKQTDSLEKITSEIHKTENRALKNNKNAETVRQISANTIDIASKGSLQMSEMRQSMANIDRASSDVSKIVKLIDDIAFQTKLLSLNAAVEAARAGKYGKGFAVVAEEVRHLAIRSTAAAKSSTELIKTTLDKVAKGVGTTGHTSEILDEIQKGINKTNFIVSEIYTASNQQTIGLMEVNTGLGRVNEIVTQNSSISKETAAAAIELSYKTAALDKMIKTFNANNS